MKRFQFTRTGLPDVTVAERSLYSDDRGFLSRIYCATEFAEQGLARSLNQINHTITKTKGSIRGLHYQLPPAAEAKLISCWRGAIFDVAVDLRARSPTFLQWHGELLTADNRKSLFIPEGCAHGFQTLTDDCELLYLHSAPYTPNVERGVRANDPKIGIRWPLPFAQISERDSKFEPLTDDFAGVVL